MTEEIWKDVVGFEDRYEVSNLGRVRSKAYLKFGRNSVSEFSFITAPKILKPNRLHNGYLIVRLYGESKKDVLVHRLVATAFVEGQAIGLEVNHKNSVRDDNNASNLEWVTKSENSAHGFLTGHHSHKGVKHPQSVFQEEDIRVIRELHAAGWSLAALGRRYGVTYQAISHIVKRKNWGHVT